MNAKEFIIKELEQIAASDKTPAEIKKKIAELLAILKDGVADPVPVPVPPTPPAPPAPPPGPAGVTIDACLFYKAQGGDYGQNRGYTSTLSVCGWSFNHQGDDNKSNAQLKRLCGESQAFGKANGLNVKLLPMIVISSDGKYTPYNGYPYDGGLHTERTCFWFGIWRNDYMAPAGLYPFPIFACGDKLDETNNPASLAWEKMVKEVAAYIQGAEFGGKFSTEFPDVCMIWEAEKLGGVALAQIAVDVGRQAFPKSRIWIHATKPEFAGVTADVIAIQSPLDPFHGDDLTDDVIRSHHEAFRKARKSANQKLMWLEWTMPDAAKAAAQRKLIRSLNDCYGTGC